MRLRSLVLDAARAVASPRTLLLTLSFAAASALAQPSTYRITHLGGGPFGENATGINAAGQVVGTRVVGYSPSGRVFWQASRWSPATGWQALGPWQGDTTGYGINDAGDVVGYNWCCGESFRWTAGTGTYHGLPAPGGDIFGPTELRINNAGQVLAPRMGVVWDAAGTPQPFTLGSPHAINNLGQIAGTADGGEAFVWTPGQGMTFIGGVGTRTVATDINDRGQVVGYYDAPEGGRNGFVWTSADGFRPFDPTTFAGSLTPIAINNGGTVVGQSDAGFAFRWTAADGVRDLNTLLDPADRSFVAGVTDINDAGQILAQSGIVSLLLNPVPEPGTLALFSLGLLFGHLASGRRRRLPAA